MPLRRRNQGVDPAQRADRQALRATAVTLLARRDLSRQALHDKLTARGFDSDATADVLAELATERLLDDERYARNFVAYHARRGQGPVRIAAELRRSGLAAEVIEAALAGGPDWLALARHERTAKFGSAPPRSWVERARQARFLQYRGFSADHIRAATGADSDTGPADLG